MSRHRRRVVSCNLPAKAASRQMMAGLHRIPLMARTSKPSAARATRAGFTLIEILIVLAIIGLLAGLAITKLGKSYDNAQITTARLFVNTTMKTPLETYRLAMGNYP